MTDEGSNRPGRHELVAYLHTSQLDLIGRLVAGLIVTLDNSHLDGGMPEVVRQTRADLIETVERLGEARQRGPGVP